jgi:cysteine desulfurase
VRVQRIYLDANATTPLDRRVREAMLPWLDAGNASSPHAEGRAARAAIDDARDQVAALVGASAREIVFTSGATEANTIALLGSLTGKARACHVVCSAIEHPSVLRTLEALPATLTLAPVDQLARLDDAFELPNDVALVSLMLANNETGTILPVRNFAGRAPILHCDAVQACGKIPVDVQDLGVDLLSLSAHKMNGPKGAGALYVRRGTALQPIAHGGEHERGLRPGTENVAAIVGLGAAAELAHAEQSKRAEHWHELSLFLFETFASSFPDAIVNSPEKERIQNTFSVTFPQVEGEAILLGLDLEGIAVATGSACSSGAAEPSHVIRALGQSREQAERSLRVSMHSETTRADLEFFASTLVRVVKNLRALSV